MGNRQKGTKILTIDLGLLSQLSTINYQLSILNFLKVVLVD